MRQTRASEAGKLLSESIIEMINLMYQNKTAINFLKPLVANLQMNLTTRIIKQHLLKYRNNEHQNNSLF